MCRAFETLDFQGSSTFQQTHVVETGHRNDRELINRDKLL